jgi:soluble lytic murein transglycosylase
MAGWIALRFLDDPATALIHFAHVDDDTTNPVVLARGAYWRGRAHEAAGQTEDMRANYEAAARYSTAYYGQLARARLGLGEMELRRPPEPASGASVEVVHAAEILYALGERDLALSFLTGFAELSDDPAALAALADLAARNDDARAVLLVGKTALARGLPLDIYAFPDIGVPHYSPIGPALDRSIVYSVARTESEFNQRDVSPAKAVGLMQVTPAAGRDTAERFSVIYDWDRLVSDPIYNTSAASGSRGRRPPAGRSPQPTRLAAARSTHRGAGVRPETNCKNIFLYRFICSFYFYSILERGSWQRAECSDASDRRREDGLCFT